MVVPWSGGSPETMTTWRRRCRTSLSSPSSPPPRTTRTYLNFPATCGRAGLPALAKHALSRPEWLERSSVCGNRESRHRSFRRLPPSYEPERGRSRARLVRTASGRPRREAWPAGDSGRNDSSIRWSRQRRVLTGGGRSRLNSPHWQCCGGGIDRPDGFRFLGAGEGGIRAVTASSALRGRRGMMPISRGSATTIYASQQLLAPLRSWMPQRRSGGT